MPSSTSVDDHDLSFATATRLRPRASSPSESPTFDVDIHPRWTVGDKPNGGYLLALLGRAASETTARDGGARLDVLSASVAYLTAPALSPAEIHIATLRTGRTASHVRATLVQADRAQVDAVFVLGALAPGGFPRYSDIRPLDIPPPEACVRLPPVTPEGVPVGILEMTELRLDPAAVPLASNEADTPAAELQGWLRFADRAEPDANSLLYFVDALPPATLRIGSTGWVPTLSMSAYVRARPAPGWLGVRFTAHYVAAGMVDETCTLWDGEGAVVAQATQLARLRFRDETSP